MIGPRWRKILKDITSNPWRTLLVMSTIGIGALAVGFVSTLYVRVLGDMEKDYQSANPHSAIIYTDSFTNDLLPSLARLPGVGGVEGRSSTGGTILSPDGKDVYLNIIVLPPPDKMQIDKLSPNEGKGPLSLGDHQILIDGSAQAGLKLKTGDPLKVTLSNGRSRTLEISGFVHDPTIIAYAFMGQAYGYVNAKTLEWLDGSTDPNMIYLAVADNKTSVPHVNDVAAVVAKKIENSGRRVYATLVYEPGKHFAASITQALIAMMLFLGLLVVLLSAILVGNTIDAVIGQQVRQIGVMKAVGASAGQIAGIYLMLVTVYGILALVVAVPVAAWAANLIGDGFAGYLNYRPAGFLFPTSTLVIQIIVAIGIPILATLVPVSKGARMTVREAITSYGLGSGRFGQSWFDRLLERIHGLPRPLLLSLRNTFRRKGRLARTLFALALAGTMFIAVFNLRASMNITIDEILRYVLSDVTVGFDRLYRTDKIVPLVMQIPGVESVEPWGGTLGNLPSLDGNSSIQLQITAPPADSQLIDPTITSGRWLLPEDENAIVIGNHLLKARPDLKVGDEIIIRIDEQDTKWKIVGTFRMGGNTPFPPVYVTNDYLSRILGASDKLASIRVITTQHDAVTQERIADQLQQVLKDNNIDVQVILTASYVAQQNTATTDVLIIFLGGMAVLIAMVGGLGLASTMSLNIIERIREIGVMRAIGASSFSIQSQVIVEGMLIGMISWVIGVIFAFPVGWLLSQIVGVAIVQSPLTYAIGWDGFVLWLVLILVISAIASSWPARSASRLTVREVLAYE
jgi:putative ABC transport system permease protein